MFANEKKLNRITKIKHIKLALVEKLKYINGLVNIDKGKKHFCIRLPQQNRESYCSKLESVDKNEDVYR